MSRSAPPTTSISPTLMTVLGLEAHLGDPRFGSYASRKQNEDALLALVEPAVCVRESHEIEATLMAAGLPCACVNDFKASVRRSAHDRARHRQGCRASAPGLDARGAQSHPARSRQSVGRAPCADAGRALRGGVARARAIRPSRIDALFAAGVTASAERKAAGKRRSKRSTCRLRHPKRRVAFLEQRDDRPRLRLVAQAHRDVRAVRRAHIGEPVRLPVGLAEHVADDGDLLDLRPR